MKTSKEAFATTLLDPRVYQLRIIDKCLEYYQEGFKSVLIESPTGSGKTPVGLVICKILQNLGLSTGWMSASRNLLHQTSIENANKQICDNPIHYISMFSKVAPKVDALVVDEAHHDACNSAAGIHNQCKPKFIVGLTATPYRADRVKLCFEKVIKDVGISYLIKNGFLSQFNHWSLKSYDPESVVHAYLDRRDQWGKTMMFFPTIDKCIEARTLLLNSGVYSEIVSGSTNKTEQIERFRNNEYNVVIGVKAISEGVNVPDLNTVFVRDSSKGPTIQMSGRLFRKNPDHPVKNLVQSISTKFPFIKHAKPVEQYVMSDGEWRSITLNPMIGKICSTTSLMLARTETVPIPYLKNNIGGVWPPKNRKKKAK